MQEWNEGQLLEKLGSAAGPFAVFMYTPFCGTCQLTERMLGIILTMKPELPIYKCNVNFLPTVIRDWQITSVPCIVIIEAGKDKKFLYTMKSVDDLYKELGPLADIKTNK